MLIFLIQCLFHEERTLFFTVLLEKIRLDTESLHVAILVDACGA